MGREDEKKNETLLCLLEGKTFSFLSNNITANRTANYTAIKTQMEGNFCGVDYKRALESKYRTLSYMKDTNISNYCNEIRMIIKELFNIDDIDVIDKIAINYSIGSMDHTIRDDVEMLQLAGRIR